MLGFGLSVEQPLWALIFVMVRIGAAFIAAPVFSAVSIPVTVRVTLSGAIGVLVLATHKVVPPSEIFAFATFLAVAAEALVGFALGFILQIAFAAPLYLTRDEVPEAEVNAERDILSKQPDLEGKPDEVKAKIVEGRIQKWLSDLVLEDQEWIHESGKKVGAALQEAGFEVIEFRRFALAE